MPSFDTARPVHTVYSASKGYSNFADGRKIVTTAGTREALVASSTPCEEVFITALEGNTGIVVVGGVTTVIANLATRRGAPLGPGESLSLRIDDLNKVGLDVMVSGEGVTFTYSV